MTDGRVGERERERERDMRQRPLSGERFGAFFNSREKIGIFQSIRLVLDAAGK